MKKKNVPFALACLCLLLAAFLAPHLYDTARTSGTDEKAGARVKITSEGESTPSERGAYTREPSAGQAEIAEGAGNGGWPGPEQWISPLEADDTEDSIRDKVLKTARTFMADFELYALNKYAGMTREERALHLRELDASELDYAGDDDAESEWKKRMWRQGELEAYSQATAREHRRNSPPPFDGPNETYLCPPVTKAYDDFMQMCGDIARSRTVTSEEREAINSVIERLNRTARTNRALVTYWDYQKRKPE